MSFVQIGFLLGGLLFAASLLLTAVSPGFWLLLASFILFYPASGAFVSLSQAELMDRDPVRRAPFSAPLASERR